MKKALGVLSAVAIVTLSIGMANVAHAFCGFYVGGADTSLYNEATMVVLMRDGTKTVLSMQNDYQGPPDGFALVVPVPEVLQEENVRTLEHSIFERVDSLAAPRLVEYWEQDPCQPQVFERRLRSVRRRSAAPPMAAAASGADLGVRIEAEFAVAEYDIVILSAEDSGGLETWLHREQYNIPSGAGAILNPYVQLGTKFFVAKVDPQRVTFRDGRAVLSPLRVHYDSDTFSLPIRLGLLNSKGQQDLIMHILAKGQRYEVANYPNVTIPTNLVVSEDTRSNFGGFYRALFDRVVEQNPGAVVTEYSWMAMNCDPCPTTPLQSNELAVLGADVIDGMQVPGQTQPSQPNVRRVRPSFGGSNGYTLTRLHFRYGAEGLDRDLVFRTAPPIVGGRGMPDAEGTLQEKHAVAQGGVNNFQGRYVMLHRWEGAVQCANPRRGFWGGPPGSGGGRPVPQPQAAPSVLRAGPQQPANLLALVADPDEQFLAVRAAPAADTSLGVLPQDTSAATEPEPQVQAQPNAVAVEPSSGGCASCSAGGSAAFPLLMLVLFALRRRF